MINTTAKKNSPENISNKRNIIIAVDSFKGCMSSIDVATNIEKGILSVLPSAKVTKLPIADGGEGTVNTLVSSTKGRIIGCTAQDPHMKSIGSFYGVLGDEKTIVIEMATTCSLTMVSGADKNPMNTTTFGVGTQIKDALKRGYRSFIIGIGGTCTNDAGIGMLQSLGFVFLDKDKVVLKDGQGGKQLSQVQFINIDNADPRLNECKFVLASDVKNVFYGKDGAAYVYAPQKGADADMVEELDRGLQNFAKVIRETFKIDISTIAGAGAAGGIGGGAIVFLNARLKSGIDVVLDAIGFDKYLAEADLVITGEGKMDTQTLLGKVPFGVAKRAGVYNVPVVSVAGFVGLSDEEVASMGISKAFEISDRTHTLEDNILNCGKYLQAFAAKIISEDDVF